MIIHIDDVELSSVTDRNLRTALLVMTAELRKRALTEPEMLDEPTAELRFVETKAHGIPARILQQRWRTRNGLEWIDVPLVSP